MLKAWDNGVKIFVRGVPIEVDDEKAKKLISQQIAEKYTGEYPPKEKMKNKF